jgi:outer membrane protein OmpA-like peptidoglycan-associated protein
MSTPRARAIGAAVAAVLAVSLGVSCATSGEVSEQMPLPPRDLPPPEERRIAQIGFEQAAIYTRCRPPVCPEVTLKTLAQASRSVPSAPVPMDPAASLAPNEALAAPATQTPPPTVSAPAPAAPVDSPIPPPLAPPPKHVIVRFEFGSAVVTTPEAAAIDAAFTGATEARRIAIHGRTDSFGPLAANQALARARAEAVRDYLRLRFPRLEAAMSIDAKGACCFAATNDNAQGRALNRRVELLIEYDARDL